MLKSSACGGDLHLLQLRLLLGVRGERVLVCLVGCIPQGGADGDGVVVESGQLHRAIAALAGAVGLVVAHAHRDARDALVAARRAFAGAELRPGIERIHVFDAVLDEERLLKAFELQFILAAVQFLQHGLENGIFFGVGARRLGRLGRGERAKSKKAGHAESSDESCSLGLLLLAGGLA